MAVPLEDFCVSTIHFRFLVSVMLRHEKVQVRPVCRPLHPVKREKGRKSLTPCRARPPPDVRNCLVRCLRAAPGSFTGVSRASPSYRSIDARFLLASVAFGSCRPVVPVRASKIVHRWTENPNSKQPLSYRPAGLSSPAPAPRGPASRRCAHRHGARAGR